MDATWDTKRYTPTNHDHDSGVDANVGNGMLLDTACSDVVNYPAASGRASGFGERATPLSAGVGSVSAVPAVLW